MFSTIVACIGAVGGIFTVLAFFPTTLAWLEQRRQGRRTEAPPGSIPKITIASASKSEWRCGIYDYPPLSHWPQKHGARPVGPLVELAREVTNSLGKTAKFEIFSYEGFYKGGDSIPDMVVGMFRTNRRAERVSFSKPFYKIGLQGICRRHQEGDLLSGLREGNLRAAVYYGEVGWEFAEDELKDACEQNRIAKLVGGHQMDTMNHLVQGTYDIVIMDWVACENFLREEENRAKFRIAFKEPLDKFDTCIGVRPENKEFLPAIDKAIEQIRNSQDYLDLEASALKGFEHIIVPRALRARH